MAERHDRLRLAWMRSGLSQAQCIERFGWNPNTFRANLNGNAPYSFKAAQDYGRAFGVRAEWLYDGADPMRPVRQLDHAPIVVPVISWVSAGDLAAMAEIGQNADTTITLWDMPPGEYFATTVKGDSMDRLSPEGAKIVVNVADKMLLRGRPYLFSLRGEATFKLWEPEPVQHLAPYSTNPAHKPIFLNGDKGWEVIGRVRRSIFDFD